MKKTLTVIAVAALVLFATSAMAGGVKVPKELCLHLVGTDIYINLAIKAATAMKISDNQKIKFYDIQGFLTGGTMATSINGSGFLDGDEFKMHYTAVRINGSVYTISADAYWLPLEGTGETLYIETEVGENSTSVAYDLEEVACTDADLSIGPPLSIDSPYALKK
jgi:hypothetical protein